MTYVMSDKEWKTLVSVFFFMSRHLWRNLHDLEVVLPAWDHCWGSFVVQNNYLPCTQRWPSTLPTPPWYQTWARTKPLSLDRWMLCPLLGFLQVDFIICAYTSRRLKLLNWYCLPRLTRTMSSQEDWMRPSWKRRWLSFLISRNTLTQCKLRVWRWLWNRSQQWTTAFSLVVTWMNRRLRQR